jgi:excisionase family DNA binding protein
MNAYQRPAGSPPAGDARDESPLVAPRAAGPGRISRRPDPAPGALLTSREVALIFGVDPKTVTRWAKSGRLSFIRTLGGHRRYLETEILALIAGSAEGRRRT